MHFNKKLGLFAFLAAPLSIVLHEIGHALAALSVGYNHLQITYHSWRGSPPLNVSDVGRAWISSGGPVVSLLLALVCYFLIRLWYESDFILALGMIAPVQFTGALLYVVGSLLGVEASTVYDSARVASYLGTNLFLTSIPGALFLPSIWYFYIQLIDKNNRVNTVSSIVVGGALGFIFWLSLIGPVIFPD